MKSDMNEKEYREYREALVEQAYNWGLYQGEKRLKEKWEDKKLELIQQGRNEVWEWCGQYIPAKEDGGEIPVEDLQEIFGVTHFSEIFDKYSYTDAVCIVKEYEKEKEQEQEEEIQVGDEVYELDIACPKVVTSIVDDGDTAVFLNKWGSYGICSVKNLRKTGRRFPEIAKILKRMWEQEWLI